MNGWRMVPVVPTPEMLDAFNSYAQCEGFIPEGYKAMLDAAPTPPAQYPKSTRCPRCDGSMMEEGEGRDRHLRCRQCTHEQPLEERK